MRFRTALTAAVVFVALAVAAGDYSHRPLASTANANGVYNWAKLATSWSAGGCGLLGVTVYNCNTNGENTASNTIYRISANGAVTNSIGTVEVDTDGEFARLEFSPAEPFCVDDVLRIVSNCTNASFMAEAIFESN